MPSSLKVIGFKLTSPQGIFVLKVFMMLFHLFVSAHHQWQESGDSRKAGNRREGCPTERGLVEPRVRRLVLQHRSFEGLLILLLIP